MSDSGFGFMLGFSSSKPAAEPEPEEKKEEEVAEVAVPSSAFGFMTSTSEASASTGEERSRASSSFSFMGGSTPTEAASAASAPAPASSPAPAPAPAPEVKAIKFEANALSGRVVKKKKKSNKIGFGREESEDDVTPVKASAPLAPSIQSVGEESNNNVASSSVAVEQEEPAMGQSAHAPPKPPTSAPSDSDSQNTKDEVDTPPPVPKSSPPSSPLPSKSASGTSSIVDDVQDKTNKLNAGKCEEKQVTWGVSNDSSVLLETVNETLQNFSQQSMLVSSKILDLSRVLKDNKKTKLTNEWLLKELKQEIIGAEADQLAAAEAEDFEQAHILSETISATQEKIIEIEGTMHGLKSEYDTATTELSETKKQIVSSFDELITTATKALKDQEGEFKKFTKEVEVKQSIEKDNIDTENKRLDLKKDKVNRDQERLSEDSQVIEDEIKTQLGNDQESRDDLEIKRFGVETEMIELEKKLAAARAEHDGLKEEIETLDTKISGVRSQHERELLIIEDRRKMIEKLKDECDQEERSIQEDAAALGTEASSFESIRSKYESWSNALVKEMEVVDVLKSRDEYLESITSSYDNSAPENSELQNKLDEAMDEYNKVISKNNSMKDKITALESESGDIEERLPKLEQEKKSHAAARKFKEAGAVAKEQQALTARKDETAEEIKLISLNIEKYSETVERVTGFRYNAEKDFKAVQRKIDIKRCQNLSKEKKILSEKREAIIAIVSEDKETVLQTKEPALSLIESELQGVEEEYLSILELHELTDEEIDTDEPEAGDAEQEEKIDDAEEEESNNTQKELEAEPESESESGIDVLEETEGSETNEDSQINETETEEDNNDSAGELADKAIKLNDLLKSKRKFVADIDEASTNEDYELAASLSEESDTTEAELQNLLSELNIEEDKAEEFVEENIKTY